MDAFKGKKVIVTGGAGFIGSHIVDALIEAGADVHIVDNLSYGNKANCNTRATLHEIDVRDFPHLQEVVRGAAVVFHLAAVASVPYSIEFPSETQDIHVTGTLNILRCAKEFGVTRVVFSSSSAVYGDQDNEAISEDTPVAPKSPYGLQKYFGERLCTLWSDIYGLSTVSLRYFNVYGVRQNPDGPYAGVIGKFMKSKKEKTPLTITGDGKQTRDFVAVEDVVRANLLAATSSQVGKGEVVNIGTGEDVSINAIANSIGGEIKYVTSRLESKHSRAIVTKAQSLLGWSSEISLSEGLTKLSNQ